MSMVTPSREFLVKVGVGNPPTEPQLPAVGAALTVCTDPVRRLLVLVDGGLGAATSLGLAGSTRASSRHIPAPVLLAFAERLLALADPAPLLATLDGQFTLVVVGSKSLESGAPLHVIAATDRQGTRPLAFAITDDAVWLSSRADVLASQPEVGADLSGQALLDYFQLGVVPSPRTIYHAVRKLPPAHVLVCTAHPQARPTEPHRRYWLPTTPPITSRDLSGLREQTRLALAAAVSDALLDSEKGAVGSFLSGGLDSSTVTGLAAQAAAARPDSCYQGAWVVSFAEEGYDESRFAQAAADHFGVKLERVQVEAGDVVAGLETIPALYDEPFGNSSALPAFLCARHAADRGITTLLAGDGGDELYAGNERYLRLRVFDHFARLPPPLRGALSALAGIPGVARLGWPGHKFVRYIEQAAVPAGRRFAAALSVNCGVAAGEALTDSLLSRGEAELALADLQREFTALPPAADVLARQLFVDWKQTLADNDLRKVNRMAEAAGVQVRYPMLDARVVEASLAVPSSEKLAHGKLREFYRETFRGLLPTAVLDKSKHGFGLPFGEWLLQNKGLETEVMAALRGTVDRGLVRPEFAERLLESQRSGERRAAAYYGTLLWSLATLEKWLSSHPVGSIR